MAVVSAVATARPVVAAVVGPRPATAGPASGTTAVARPAPRPRSAATASATFVPVVTWSSVLGHLHPQVASIIHSPIQSIHGVLSITFVVESDKGEASALLGVLFARYVDVSHLAVLLEEVLQVLCGSAVSQVVHLQ